MQLSTRLQMVVDLVTRGNVVADVGCDHAYISIYLVEHGIAPATIALDVNKGPLLRANENIKRNGYEAKIQTRLSNGLEKLLPGETDSIVIAGMGGPLMITILSQSMKCTQHSKEIILQPQSEIDQVRQYLHSIGFIIVKEAMCKDEGKYYTAFRAIKAQKSNTSIDRDDCVNEEYQDVYNKYGEYLLCNKDNVLYEYLEKELKKTNEILESLRVTNSTKAKERIKSLELEVHHVEKALDLYR